jgi:flagellar basal-body rod modification protein FlgD
MDVLQGISGISTAQTTTASSTAASKVDALGRDHFLTLFLAQLKNQDPLNPMESQEFSAQLAQFSSLEQLFNVNENLDSILTTQADSSRLQALDFIGKEIVAEGDALYLEQGKIVTGQFDLEAAAAECTVKIVDEDGIALRTIPMGYLNAGSHSFQWDGRDSAGNAMESGVYTYEIVALSGSGSPVRSSTWVMGTVTGVNLEGTGVKLYVGDIPVAVSEVKNIRTPSALETSVTQ